MMKKIAVVLMVLLLMNITVGYVFAEETYYIQVGAFSKENNALKHQNYLISIGLPAVIVEVHDFYKVFLGPFSSEEEARSVQASYDNKGFLVLGSEMFDVIEPKPKAEVIETDKATEETQENNKDQDSEKVDTETKEDLDEVEETGQDEEKTDSETDATEESEGNAADVKEDSSSNDVKEDSSPSDVDPEELKNDLIKEQIKDDEKNHEDYKMFTIILIMVLWLLFLSIVIVFRLNQSKAK